MELMEYDVKVRELPRVKYKDVWYSTDGVYFFLFDDDDFLSQPYHRITKSRVEEIEDYINRFS